MNYEFFDNQTQESAEELVDALHRGERPIPTRGAQVVTFKEISRQLAGFRDPRPEAAAAGLAHPDAPTPVDVTGTEDIAGTDIGPAPEAAGYGVRGGVTERVLSDRDAAKTYGEPATVDAGVVGAAGKKAGKKAAGKKAGSSETGRTGTDDADTDPNLRPVKADNPAEPTADSPESRPTPTADGPSSDEPAPDRER